MTPTSYEIRVSGALLEDAVADFGDVHVLTTDVTTVLSGDIADQAALLGLLARFRALGLNIVEVRRVLRAPDPDAQRTAESDNPRPDRDPPRPPQASWVESSH